MILCFLCMLIVLFIFQLEIKVTKNALSYKDYILKEMEYEDNREVLFTKLYKSINTNVTELNINNLKNFLSNSKMYFRTEDNRACIKYDISTNRIFYESIYENKYCRKDLYDYKIIQGKVSLIYINSQYIEGAIE
ncbi:hypothetical protein [Candidatus Clostridium radicumherbarum]|uniref:Uncharacterized protein n=1 Tax=Candidatus Clostridium radicumherbarum TaxID=3381662 RepID=A0ABW8TRS8_9CLOT